MASISNIANIVFRHEYQDAGFTQGMNAGAAAADKAAAAGEKLAGATSKTTREVTAAIPAWQTVNKLTDDNAKLTAATEKANASYQARLAALRLEASKNAEVKATEAEREQILAQRRDAAIAQAARQIEQERARWAGVTNGAANATGAFGSLSRVAGSAGQQLQDVVIQAQMGTSAFTILAQQGSQFLGGFGPGGAVAGAALAIGAVALAALGLTGNVKTLDDAVKESAANFERVTSAAEERVKGFKAEAEAIDSLAASYSAMGTAAAKAESIILERQNKQLTTSAGALTESLGGRLASDLRQQEGGTGPAIANFEDVTGLANSAAKLSTDLTAAVEAYRQFRDAGPPTIATVRLLITALDDASRAGGGNNLAIAALRDKAIEAMPQVATLEKALRDNAIQAEALRIAAGGAATGLDAAGASADAAGGKLGALAPGIRAATAALAQLRKDAADDPLKSVNAEAARVADLTAALRNGGIPAYERFKDAQDASAKAQETLNKRQKEFIEAKAPTIGREAAEAEAQANRGKWALDIQNAAQAERDLARELEVRRKAENDAEAASKRAGTAAATAARQAAEAAAEFNRNHYSEPRLTAGGELLSLGTSDDKALAFLKTRGAEIRRSQKDLTDAAKDEAKEQQQTAKTATDSVVRYAGDAFADLFRDNKKSWSEMWAGFLGTARSTIARIAAEAIIRPIIAPIISGVMSGGGGVLNSLGQAVGLGSIGAGQAVASYGAPGLGIGSIGSAYSLNQGLQSGVGAFAPGVRSSLGIGFVDNALNAPISTMSVSSGESAFRSAAGLAESPSYTVGNALGAGASIIGGGFNIYQGIQRGGIGGGVQAVGGGIGVAAGAASAAAGAGLIGASSTLAMLGPYGMIAAAILAIVSQFLPGEKPANMTGSGAIDLATGAIDTYGQGGSKFSQANRDAATSAVQGVGQMAAKLSTLLGDARIGGRATIDVGNRDGIAARFISPAGVDSDTWHFARSAEGNADLQKFLVLKMIESVHASLAEPLRDVISEIPKETAEGILTALAKIAAVTDGGNFSANQTIASRSLDYSDVDKAVSELQWVRDVYDPLVDTTKATDAFHKQLEALQKGWQETIEHAEALGLATDLLGTKMAEAETALWEARNKAVGYATDTIQGRINRATVGDNPLTALSNFDLNAEQQRDAWRAQLEAWGLDAVETASRIVLLERALGAERSQVLRKANEAMEAQWRTVFSSAATLQARIFRASGDELSAALYDFEVSAANQRANLRTTLADAFAGYDEIERQAAMLETALGMERLKITKDYNQKITDAENERAAKATDIVTGLTDYARSLRTRGDSPLSVQEQYMGASSDFYSNLGKAQAGDGDALARITASADTFLSTSRAVYGSGSGYATDYGRVLDAIGGIAAATPEQLTAAIYQTEMRTQTQVLNDSLVLLRTEVVALRKEVQLNGAATGRAA